MLRKKKFVPFGSEFAAKLIILLSLFKIIIYIDESGLDLE
jgi:hypothetical protein